MIKERKCTKLSALLDFAVADAKKLSALLDFAVAAAKTLSALCFALAGRKKMV